MATFLFQVLSVIGSTFAEEPEESVHGTSNILAEISSLDGQTIYKVSCFFFVQYSLGVPTGSPTFLATYMLSCANRRGSGRIPVNIFDSKIILALMVRIVSEER